MIRADRTDIVYGRWPVREALEAETVSKLVVAHGVSGPPMDEILDLARRKKVPIDWAHRRQLDKLVGHSHQGVLAYVTPLKLTGIDSLWRVALGFQGRGPCVLFLDGIQDPQNLGSILRSAVFFGVPAVVIPKWRAASMTAAVVRASAGAARLVPVAQVSNLAAAMETAREKGVWLVGADISGSDAKTADLPRPFGLILGSEGEGLHQLIKKKCDLLVQITGAPHRGIKSLNVGVACGVLLNQFS